MKPHDLTRKTEPDAGAVLFGCEERNEDLILTLLADLTLVCIQPHILGLLDICTYCSGNHGLLAGQVDYSLGKFSEIECPL